ncbi:YkvA family protein [Novosphingobium sp. Chol11]|uniref:YkvA family protein n=1 Tax=Novosphingobium sp. Chol11 TaxID=1385763 RepID=UPI001C3EBA10|nr:DUF1232 domain-containing protein [Novosphingobium sp. Chol11]
MTRTAMTRLKAWARNTKRDIIALWLAARDPRVAWYAKALAAAVAAYALSPVDLIPDFIPVLGYLDDLVIVPLGIMAAVRLVPPDVMAELRMKAVERRKPVSVAGLIFVVIVWIVAVGFVGWMLVG